MKRYMLFAFDTFYPSGGMSDFIDYFDTQEELDALKKEERFDFANYQVYDLQEKETIDLNNTGLSKQWLNSRISEW